MIAIVMPGQVEYWLSGRTGAGRGADPVLNKQRDGGGDKRRLSVRLAQCDNAIWATTGHNISRGQHCLSPFWPRVGSDGVTG